MSASGLHMLAHPCTLNTHTAHTDTLPPYHIHIHTPYIIHTLHNIPHTYTFHTLNTIHRHYTHVHYIHINIRSTHIHTSHTHSTQIHDTQYTTQKLHRHILPCAQTLHTLCSHTHTYYIPTDATYTFMPIHPSHRALPGPFFRALTEPSISPSMPYPPHSSEVKGCPRIPTSRIKPTTPVHQMLYRTLPSTP